MSHPLVHAEHVWDTVVSIHLGGEDLPTQQAALTAIVAWLHHVDEVFSSFRADSVLCRWQRGELTATPELQEVLDIAVRVEELTEGYFDLHWNGVADPTGIVKGWAVDRAVGIATRHGIRDLMINAGGDLSTRGSRGNGQPWRVGIADPADATTIIAIVNGYDLNVATSGPSERGEHIRCREPRTALAASVCGPDLVFTDGIATAAISAGGKAIDLLTELDGQGWSSQLLLEDRTLWRSAGWGR